MGPSAGDEVWARLQSVPSMDEEPVVWDPRAGKFVSAAERSAAVPTAAVPPAAGAPGAGRGARPGEPPPPKGRKVASSASPPPGDGRPAPAVTVSPAPGPVPAPPPAARVPRPPSPPAPTVSPSPRPGPRPSSPRPPSRRRPPRHRWLFRLGVVLLPLLVILVGTFGFLYWQFSQIERVDTAAVLSPSGGGGTNYLIVGSDSREGIEAGDANADAFLDGDVEGRRTDTIMLLRLTPDGSELLSIPRDLWVTNPQTGEPGRINGTFRDGPTNLIRAVQGLGLPVHHYLEINFVSFGSLVDAVGGITVDFPHPARDTWSGLLVEETGPVTLRGEQALAYVRSRHHEELIDGEWRADGRGDLARIERQQVFLRALLAEAGGTRNPVAAKDLLGALEVGLRIDDTISFFDAVRLGLRVGDISLDSVELPVVARTTSGGAEVLELEQPEADVVIARFGGTGTGSGG